MDKKKWRRNQDVVARRIGEETILVPTGRNIVDLQCLFTLNETGSFIWERLECPCSFTELSSALVQSFEVTEEHARQDLELFLDELVREGCIVAESGT